MNAIESLGRGALDILRKNAPEILMVTGLSCGAGAIGYGVYKGWKVTSLIDDCKDKAEVFRTGRDIALEDEECQTPEAQRAVKVACATDIAKEIGKTSLEVAKTLHPVLILEGACIGCCLASNRLQAAKIDKLSRDLAAVTSAYIGLDKLYKKMRENVKAKYGEEEEELMRRGVIVENEKGEKKVVLPEELNEENKAGWKKTCDEGNDVSGWDVIWNEAAGPLWPQKRNGNLYGYSPDPVKARNTLKDIETQIQSEIRRPHGHAVVNDLYKKLGYQAFCSEAGQVIGWWNETDRWLSDDEVSAIFNMDIDSRLNNEAKKGSGDGWYVKVEPMGVVLDHINNRD